METFYYLIGRDTDPVLWWQMAVRTTIIFVYAMLLYRIGLRKLFNRAAVLDIVVIVILGSSLSRALTGNAPLIATLVSTALLIALHALLSFSTTQSDRLSFLVKGRALQLVSDGEIVWDNLKKAQMGERDLMQNLRLSGARNLSEVEEAWLERNGEVSVFKADPKAGGGEEVSVSDPS